MRDGASRKMTVRLLAIISPAMLFVGCLRGPVVPPAPEPDLSEAYVEVKAYLTESATDVEASP